MGKEKKIILGAISAIASAYLALTFIAKRKKADSIYDNDPDQKNLMEGKEVIFVEDDNDKENADGVRGHLEIVGIEEIEQNVYDKYIKHALDKILAFGGLVFLSPLFLATALAIKIEDPGPVFFTQKRVGKNKQYFKIHKFRSMRMDTPHDVPTHMLPNPNQYITKVGKFIRAHSIDGNVIIGQTTESLVNKGFREVSPIHFSKGRDLFSKSYNDFHTGGEGVLVA